MKIAKNVNNSLCKTFFSNMKFLLLHKICYTPFSCENWCKDNKYDKIYVAKNKYSINGCSDDGNLSACR